MAWNTSVRFYYVPNYVMNNGQELNYASYSDRDTDFANYLISTMNIEKGSYVRRDGGQIRVKGNYDDITALAPNFLVFTNTNFTDKKIYANITGFSYISPNVTEISYATNNWLTYFEDLNLSFKSYVARRTFSKNEDDSIISQLPFEDLDIGEDYLTADALFDYNGSDGNFEENQFYYIMMTKALTKTGSTHSVLTGSQTSNIVNDNTVSQVTTTNGINNILYGYIMNFRCFNACVERGLFSEDCDLVNSLQLVIELPFGRDVFPSGISNIYTQISTSDNPDFGTSLPSGSELYDQGKFGSLTKDLNITGFGAQLNDYINKMIANNTEQAYNSTFNNTALGKYLLRYPYSLIEIFDFSNQPLTIRPESINRNDPYKVFRDKSLPIVKYASIGQNPMLVYGIKGYGNTGINANYNAQVQGNAAQLYNVTNMNLITLAASINLPIINDYLISILQSNQNQINSQRANVRDTLATQINNAAATMQATALSISMNYRNAEIAANTDYLNARTQAQMTLTTNLNNANTAYQVGSVNNVAGLSQNLVNAAGSLSNLDIGSAVTGVVNAGIGYMAGDYVNALNRNNSTVNANLQNAAALQMANNTRAASLQMASNSAKAAQTQASVNYANTLRSANTAYVNSMRSINARLQDAKNVPDSVQTMGNNSSIFNLMYNRDFIKYSTKVILPEVIQRLIGYWLRAGFLANRTETLESVFDLFEAEPGFYIQTINANIGGKIPQDALMSIITMFNAGVHFWNPGHYMDFDGMRGV